MSPDITDLLGAWRGGDASAMDRLMPLVYADLKRRAQSHLRRAHHATLSPTGLVHEAYVKLASAAPVDWQDRNHFFAVASKAMRSVIVDAARKRLTKKRGALRQRVPIDDDVLRVEADATEILAIHEALDRLAAIDGGLAELVEQRFFGGLSFAEIGEARGVAEVTVKRAWSKARTLLFQILEAPNPAGAP